MSGASEAAQALQQATDAAYRSVYRAGARFAQASSAVSAAVDLMDVLRASVDAVVAIEALHAAADDAVATLREILAETMDSTGATTIQGTHHSVGVAKRPHYIDIHDLASIPEEYLVTKKTPDKRAIADAIVKTGALVPGATLIQPNKVTLRITAKKEAAVP